MRALLGTLAGLLVWLWARTWRVSVAVHPAVGLKGERPLVFAFWHGRQMPLVALRRRRRTAVMVSHSADGALQAGVMRTLGLSVVRGSASRGGARGLLGIIRALKSAADAAFAVDGPHGPLHRAKAGAARAALRAGAELVPVGAAASPSVVLSRAWDHFRVPLPLARVSVVLGPPVDPTRAARHPELLSKHISAAVEQAEAEFVVAPRSVTA